MNPSRRRWLEVLTVARRVAQRTGFTGDLTVLVIQSLEQWGEMWSLAPGGGAGPTAGNGPRPGSSEPVNTSSRSVGVQEERSLARQSDCRARAAAESQAPRPLRNSASTSGETARDARAPANVPSRKPWKSEDREQDR